MSALKYYHVNDFLWQVDEVMNPEEFARYLYKAYNITPHQANLVRIDLRQEYGASKLLHGGHLNIQQLSKHYVTEKWNDLPDLTHINVTEVEP